MSKILSKASALTILLSFAGMLVTAQTVLRGKIIDKAGKPIQGVSVSELDADNRIVKGAQTDVAGNYVLNNANVAKNRISVSFIGYKTITQKINGRTAINLTLEENQGDLGEVVITARPVSSNGMMNITEKNLTTAVAKINAK